MTSLTSARPVPDDIETVEELQVHVGQRRGHLIDAMHEVKADIQAINDQLAPLEQDREQLRKELVTLGKEKDAAWKGHAAKRGERLREELGAVESAIQATKDQLVPLEQEREQFKKELAALDRGKIRAGKGWYMRVTKRVASTTGVILEYDYYIYRRYVTRDYRSERILERADGKQKRRRKRSRKDRRRKK